MGADALMRRRAWVVALFGAAVAAVVVMAWKTPGRDGGERIERYDFGCFPHLHRDERVPIQAPMRTLVADGIAQRLDAGGVAYERRGNVFLLRLTPETRRSASLPPSSDTAETFSNELHKFAVGFAQGYGFRERAQPLPSALERVIARWEEKSGIRLPRTADHYLTYDSAYRLPACGLVRAVLTVADDTPEERAADALLSERRARDR